MMTLFIACAAIGGVLLALQLLLGVFGVDHHHGDIGHGAGIGDASEGLNLFSVRALTAGVAFFGVTGAALTAFGVPSLLAVPPAAAVGFGAMYSVAYLIRQMLLLEEDGTARIEEALGEEGTVYLSIPGEKAGTGKILLTVRERTMELEAVTAAGALPVGASVTVVDVIGPDVVEVRINQTLGDVTDAVAR